MSYTRVIPRDLFNESKLLKCIGRLCLFIEDGLGLGITYKHLYNEFDIIQDWRDGSISINNITFEYNNQYLNFKTTLNSKQNYPLYCTFEDEEVLVFDSTGEFTDEFKEFLTTIK